MLSLNENLSFYSILAMWGIAYYPYFAKSSLLGKYSAYDGVQPRTPLLKKDMPAEVVARIARLDGAHLNGLENLPLLGLAVIAGTYAGIDNQTLNLVSGGYLLTRMLFNYIYINQTTVAVGKLRSAVWVTSLCAPWYLLIKAAGLVAQKS